MEKVYVIFLLVSVLIHNHSCSKFVLDERGTDVTIPPHGAPSGGHQSVSIVHLQTKSHGVCFVFCVRGVDNELG
jgi:hypothetical protein